MSFEGICLYGKTLKQKDAMPDCKVYQIANETGTGEITCYQVFSGIELFYNDMHTEYCSQDQRAEKNVIEINHCLEGRYECHFGESSCSYMAAGDLSIVALTRKKTYSAFPLCHYRGITIVLNLEDMESDTRHMMALLGIELERIQKYICDENRCCIMRASESVEHFFSELYHVKEQRKAGYMKIKVLELLLLLSDLDTNKTLVHMEYYSRDQIKRIKEIAAFITSDLTKHYTIEQLSQKFHISATALKKCFRGVYGSSVYAYLRTYRLQMAEKMLRETDLSVADISSEIGYENSNKFSTAFKSAYGVSPTVLRNSSVILLNNAKNKDCDNPR